MKNTKLGRSKWSAFLTGKGFYIAVCLCAVALSAAAYFVVDSTKSGISAENESRISMDLSAEETPSGQPVVESQSDVPKSELSSVPEEKPVDQPTAAPEIGEESRETGSSGAARVFSNTFFLPLQGEVIGEYSGGKPVKSKTMNDWRTHDGVDIRAEIATPVKASSDGIVTSIEQDPMWGVVITVDHGNGYETFYMGLNVNVSVKKDQTVEIGTVLGSVGQTAEIEIAEAPHLHFAMKKDGEWIDPMSMMQNA